MKPDRRLLVVAVAMVLLLVMGRVMWGALRQPPGTARVEKGDLVIDVEVIGTLRAVESSVRPRSRTCGSSRSP